MKIGGDYFDGAETKLPRACHVLAKWISNEIRPCKILHFIEKTIEVTTISGELQLQTYIFAKVIWFQEHQKKTFFAKPLECWCKSIYEDESKYPYLPVDRIQNRFIPIQGKVPLVGGNTCENALIVCPAKMQLSSGL